LRAKYRRQFQRNKEEVERFNANPNNTYRQTINKFSHLTVDEALEMLTGVSLLRYNYPKESIEERALFDPPCKIAPIDWRTKGAVTPV
jgi:hypothetical protein